MYKITCVVNDKVLESSGLRSEHGLSFWIETPQGTALFDTGSSEEVFLHNLKTLGLQPQKILAAALSHGHYDHTGGLMALARGNTQPQFPIHAHPAIFDERFSRKKGVNKPINSPFNEQAALKAFNFQLSEKPQEILPGLWTSGEISSRPEQEGRSSGHYIRSDDSFLPDPYKDDLSLFLKTDAGAVLICGCCHAGLLNTLYHVRHHFQEPIHTIIGGTHLVTANGSDLRHIIEVLSTEFGGISYYLNHCTGDTAIETLSENFGDLVHPFPAGAAVEFK